MLFDAEWWLRDTLVGRNKEENMNRRALLLAVSILCCAAAILPASAQHFKQIPGSLAQIAAGRSEVWGLDPSNAVYRFSSGTKTFARVGTIKLSRIAVGGGTALQTDQVWGVAASGKVYRYNYAKSAFSLVPGTLSQIVVGEGYKDNCHPYEVWGLDASQLIYRYNYCTLIFDQIPGSLTVIATGAGAVWGLNGAAEIFVFDRDLFGPKFLQVPGSLQRITVGVNDVWGEDGGGGTYRYDGLTGQFVAYPPACSKCTQFTAGGEGVWYFYVSGSNFLYHLDGPRFTYVIGPLAAAQIAVGYGAGVWVLDSSNQVFAFVRP
jgi:hypothetical protein